MWIVLGLHLPWWKFDLSEWSVLNFRCAVSDVYVFNALQQFRAVVWLQRV